MRARHRLSRMAPLLVLALLLAACATPGPPEDAAVDEADDTATAEPEDTEPEDLVEVEAGYVSGMDQMGLPAALDVGFFEEHGLDVELAQPFPTGVDALNALQAGEVDFVQVGTPSIGAVLSGMDLVYLGNYSGSSVQKGIDETMAMVAREGSGIDADDLTTLEGKTVGVSIGSINHLYLLGVLEEVGIDPGAVEIVNTPPPEMPVAIQTGGLDAIVVWDPWPIVTINDVEGAYEVSRGGGYISYIGYVVALRDFVEDNPDIVERFLAARAEADQWMRDNPQEAADVATRWLPGTEPEVAEEAMQYNVVQLDPRFSACNYLALHVDQQLLLEVDAIDDTYDVNEHFVPEHILSVMETYPEFFDDLEEIPEPAQIGPDYVFDPEEAEAACA